MAPVTVRVRRREIIIVVYMAVRAGIHLACWGHLMRTNKRPARHGVIEHHVRPQCRVVAGRTIRRCKRRARRRVRWVVGLLPGRQMASGVPAVCRLDRQIVVVVGVAVCAGIHLARRRHLVRIRQRKTRNRVIKGRRQERDGVVTVRAVRCGERGPRGRMRGVVRSLPAAAVVGIQMALGVAAIGRLDLQIVVVVDVTVRTGIHFPCRRQLMCIRQGEAGRRMVKIRGQPRNSIVAARTSGDRKYRRRCRVLRIGGLLPRCKVTTCMPAVRRRNLQIVIATNVATLAGNIRVPACQREIDRGRGVIEGCA